MRARCTSVEMLYYSIEMEWLNIYVPRLTLWIFDSTAPVPVGKKYSVKAHHSLFVSEEQKDAL